MRKITRGDYIPRTENPFASMQAAWLWIATAVIGSDDEIELVLIAWACPRQTGFRGHVRMGIQVAPGQN
jgi:hypothetical protein